MKREIIAEIGQNYNGCMTIARSLIEFAKDNGADVAKFQLYDESLTIAYTRPLEKDELKMLKQKCDSEEIEFMCSVFSPYLVEWTEEIGMERYKIASRSVNDIELINTVYSTGKPIIISLGMLNNPPTINKLPKHIVKMYDKAPDRIKFLYCIMKYPAEYSDLHFPKMGDSELYAGFSDHTKGIIASCMAFILGATIIEKHFTLNTRMEGPDHKCSIAPDQLNLLSCFRNGEYNE